LLLKSKSEDWNGWDIIRVVDTHTLQISLYTKLEGRLGAEAASLNG
jgi:hypothetical protein